MTNYPLTWPAGWKRTKPEQRKDANFKRNGQRLSIADGVTRVIEQLRLLGIEELNTVISTNVKPRLDGMPRSDERAPLDPGVAVYWLKGKDTQHKVMATDRYTKVADNLAAIAATLEAMRAIERHGGAVILERAFTGFLALPAPNTWRAVMRFDEDDEITLQDAKDVYRTMSFVHHPDRGGSESKMAELNWAIQEAEKEFR